MLLTAALTTHAQTEVVGTWLVQTKDSKIQIYEKNNKYYGKIIWLKNPNAKDDHNPNPALRQRPALGIVLLNNFIYNPTEKLWQAGTIYNPRDGNSYRSELQMKDKNTLIIRGYWTIFYKTEILTRTN
jgi:uncharacterized protein (DUF2147 family)